MGECARESTLKRRISGWVRERGLPLTLMRPLPCWMGVSFASIHVARIVFGVPTLQCATAVAVRPSALRQVSDTEALTYRSSSCRSTAHFAWKPCWVCNYRCRWENGSVDRSNSLACVESRANSRLSFTVANHLSGTRREAALVHAIKSWPL